MSIKASGNNPFQLPQLSQKPVQPQANFFRSPGGAPGGHAPAHPPQDGLGLFKSQIASKSITPNLSSPRPPQGSGSRLFAMG